MKKEPILDNTSIGFIFFKKLDRIIVYSIGRNRGIKRIVPLYN